MTKTGGERDAAAVGRRELLAGAAGAAGLFGLGALARAREESAPLVRPPGSRPEAEFLARCLRCDRCRSVCHTDAVGVAHLEDGLLAMRTPVMAFHLGHCDFCRRCAEVCPTGAIEDFDPKTAKIGLAVVTESCIALRTGACTKCHEACPYDAVALDHRRRPVVDPQKCNGCGMCELICPSNVFQAYQAKRVRGIVVRPSAALTGGPDGADGSSDEVRREAS